MTLGGVKAFSTYFCFVHSPTLLNVYLIVPDSAFFLNRPNDVRKLAKKYNIKVEPLSNVAVEFCK